MTSDGVAITIVSVNLNANDVVLNENSYNDPPDAGNRFVMARVRVQNVGDDPSREIAADESDFAIVVSGVKYDDDCGYRAVPDQLRFGLFAGGIRDGNVCFEIPESSANLVLFYDPLLGNSSDRRWLTLANPDSVEAPRVVEASLDPSPGQTPGHFRTNPMPPGTTVETADGLALTLVSVNLDATDAVLDENPYNDPPDAGNRFVMARVRVQNVGGDANSEKEVEESNFRLVGTSAVRFVPLSYTGAYACPDELDGDLFLSGMVEGNVCFQIPQSETGLVLFYYPGDSSLFDLRAAAARIGPKRRWLTLATPEGIEAVRVVESTLEPSPGQMLGHFRTNPVPLGTWVETDDGLRLTAISVNPDATDVVMSEGSWVDPPAEGNRFFMARVRVENVAGDADRETDIAYPEFKLVGSSAVKFSTFDNSCGEVPDRLSADLFPGGVAEGNVCFEIPQSETDLILFHDPIFGPRKWMRLPN